MLYLFKHIRVNAKLLFFQFVKHRQRYISDRNFLIVASLIVGVLSGFAAVSLKTIVHGIQHLLESGFDVKYENYLYLLSPLLGIMLSVWYVRLFHKRVLFDKGLSSIIFSISKRSSNIERHKMYSHVITAALTTGLGGSVGLEAPIAVTGSAIGSNTAKFLLVTRQEKTLLLASGAAAGIAAIFNSPIGGVIFAFEVLLSEVTVPAFIPLLIASASGAVISRIFYSGQLFFLTTEGWSFNALPFYMVLGICCGLLSVYMMRTTLAIEGYFHKRRNSYFKGLAGGILIGALIFLLPPLYGEGYQTVNALLAGDPSSLLNRSLFFRYNHNDLFLLAFTLVVIFVKVLASATTVGSGGNGGIFGPALFTGALSGFFFSRLVNYTGIAQLNEQNFIAVSMGGLISGVLHAPLTGIFLIAEVSGGYNLFVPLMIVSALSFFVVRYFEPNSIYTKKLIEQGLITRDKDTHMLSEIDTEQLIEHNFATVQPQQTLRELVQVITTSRRNIFPVVTQEGKLEGIIIMDDIREVLFNAALYDQLHVRDLMSMPPVIARPDSRMDQLMKYFEEYGVWNIPVVDTEERYLGFISKSGVLDKYRQQLTYKNDAVV